MSGERARLFVALDVPREIREALARWRTEALGGAEAVRPVAADNLHVTLCFLGWRELSDVDAIAEVCQVVRGRGAVELLVGDPAALPRRRPRVLAVSLEDPPGELAATQAALSAALEASGFYEPEQRPFFGHVTVARAGRGARIPCAELLAPPPPRLSFRASRVVLYRSHLRRGGTAYEALARIELAPVEGLSPRRG